MMPAMVGVARVFAEPVITLVPGHRVADFLGIISAGQRPPLGGGMRRRPVNWDTVFLRHGIR